ncbi:MAG: putative glycoside hydrolase [Lachnospiraceae bacterium]|nr:putative glycoside hydrolase [Lachnospiraceae bacterium]
MDELIALVEETELNTMVIDIKNDEGAVTYKMQSDMVLEIESGVRYIRDIDALVEKLHEKDIYLIARIVAFKDPYLAEKKPELSLKTKSGEVFRDKNKEAWVNPYKKEVWDYLMEIGTQAAEAGFDEIQFDYIRFSTDVNADDIDYGEEAETKTKEEAITEFTEYAYETLHPLGVVVSADVFGTIIDNESDREIVGQNYRDMAAHLDYICPMVYPSHYSNGVYNIEVPDKAPYDTVYQAMNISKEKLETDEQIADVRVWIQDFTASWLKDYISYGAEEVRAQIQAVYDAGYEEWILWNAKMNYTKEALLPYWTEEEPVPADEDAEPIEETVSAEEAGN